MSVCHLITCDFSKNHRGSSLPEVLVSAVVGGRVKVRVMQEGSTEGVLKLVEVTSRSKAVG